MDGASRPKPINTIGYETILTVPIPADEFRAMDPDDRTMDLSPETTQGRIYRFLLRNADSAFRQRELVDAIDVPRGSVGPTLARLEQAGLVEHRGHYWAVADAEHAVDSAGAHGLEAADDVDGGYPDEAVDRWLETALTPPDDGDPTP